MVDIINKAVDEAIERRLHPAAPTSRAVTIKVFAAAQGVSEATVNRMIKDGLPTIRVGRRGVRIPIATADTWLANRKKAA